MIEFCNPLDINYKYQHYGKYAHREGADPTLILFKGKYYLFVSMSAGFYHSDDLMHWQWHENRELEMYLYAPDVRQIGDYLYFCASDKGCPCRIWRSKDPLSDDFEVVSEVFPFWDPNLFQDDDGRVYLYWGSSNAEPIWGTEMDPETMQPIGKKKGLINQHKNKYGWERFHYPGKPKVKLPFPDNMIYWMFFGSGRPFLEGPFMNKWNGKYYLQYAAPATEAPIYSDGYYVSDSPLGPFTYAPNSPFCTRPSGFIAGSGHGSTIEDAYGNLWHVASMCVCVNQNFERRLGLFPAKLDKDGLLWCNQHFADYPYVIPEGKFDAEEIGPQYMLLSYRKNVTASSCVAGHGPELAVDESIRSWWCAEGCRDEWIQVDLGERYQPHSIQLNFADEGIAPMKMPPEQCAKPGATGNRYVDSGKELRTRYLLEGSLDGKNWFVIEDKTRTETDLPHPFFVLKEGTMLRYVRLTGVERPYGSRLAVSSIRVFGIGNGEKPASVEKGAAQMADGGRSCFLRWQAVPNAMGYNVRFGIAPDKLYSSYQVYGEAQVRMITLNADQNYFYAIDAFNENGITPGRVNPMNEKER